MRERAYLLVTSIGIDRGLSNRQYTMSITVDSFDCRTHENLQVIIHFIEKFELGNRTEL